MDPARLPHAPYPLAPDSQSACFVPWLKAPRADPGGTHDALVTRRLTLQDAPGQE